MNDSFLSKFSDTHLLVAGEVGIDAYVWGEVRRISPEAPVPIVEVESESKRVGLAGNVAQNLVSLGAKTTLLGVRGRDEHGEELSGLLRRSGIDDLLLLEDESRPTLRKTRIIAHEQHIVRIDHEKVHPLAPQLTKAFNERICDLLSSVDGVIVQDYGKGLWSADTMSFIKEAKLKKKPVFVDPSRTAPLSLYRGCTLLTPNVLEAQILCKIENQRLSGADDPALQALALQILNQTESEHSIVTCGPWGMVSVSRENTQAMQIPTFARKVFDVTGAGDTVIAAMSLMHLTGEPLKKCMEVANAAAGLVVGEVGTATVTVNQLRDELSHLKSLGLIQ